MRFIQLYQAGWEQHGDLLKAIAAQTKETDQGCAALITEVHGRVMQTECERASFAFIVARVCLFKQFIDRFGGNGYWPLTGVDCGGAALVLHNPFSVARLRSGQF